MNLERSNQVYNASESNAFLSRGVLQRKCDCGNHTQSGEECTACSNKKLNKPLQTKLKIGDANDRYEQEADRVAEQVMQMPSPKNREANEYSQAKPFVQRCVSNSQSGAAEVPPIVHEVLHTAGQPLDQAARDFMEPRFDNDFSRIRVHSDAKAAKSTNAVNAIAYTVGKHLVFNTGQYAPQKSEGRKLLAHELTHVVQQGAHVPSPSTRAMARLQRLGANPGCTTDQSDTIHQAIFNARGWLNKAIPQLEASPLSKRARSSLRRNFGPTYGVPANASLIAGRLRTGYSEISTIPFRCRGAGDAFCGRASPPCGYAHAGAGGHAATICNGTLNPGTHWIFQAGCTLHESFHAAFSRFTTANDRYSGWHGRSSSSADYPGTGIGPLLNADSYTTLAMDLS